jgi:hypothetical protein
MSCSPYRRAQRTTTPCSDGSATPGWHTLPPPHHHGAHHGIRFPLLADSHPKGAVAGAYGVYPEHKDKSNQALLCVSYFIRLPERCILSCPHELQSTQDTIDPRVDEARIRPTQADSPLLVDDGRKKRF